MEIRIKDGRPINDFIELVGDGMVGNSRWANSGLINGDKIIVTVSDETVTIILSNYQIFSLRGNTLIEFIIFDEIPGVLEFSGTIGTYEAFEIALTSGASITVNLVDVAGNITSIPGIVAE